MITGTAKKIPYGKRFFAAHELPGKTLMVRIEGRHLPVLCYEAKGEELFGLQIRGKNDRDSFPTNWLVGIGDHGLLNESVAMVAKQKVFHMQDVVRVLGLVSPQALDAARRKRGIIEARPAMKEQRAQVVKSIAKERRKGHKTKGLNRQLKKLDRALNGPQRPRTRNENMAKYIKTNPKPMQGGTCTPK